MARKTVRARQAKPQSAVDQLKPIFLFPFKDREATNRFIIGCALMLGGFVVPIIPALIAYGYALRILRSSAEGEPPSMPEWDDWGSLLSLGFRGGVVGFVLSLPSFVVFTIGMAAYFGTFLLIPLTSGSDSGEGGFVVLFLLAMGVLFLSMALGFLLLLVAGVLLPGSVSHLVAQDKLGAAFRVQEWWSILWANRLGYFIGLVVVAGIFGISYWVFIVLYSTLILLCLAFLVIPPIGYYGMLVAAALFGEIYREGTEALQQATPPRGGARR